MALEMKSLEKEEKEGYIVEDEEVEEPKKAEWDIESIASTYTNTDNRPQVLAEETKEKKPKKDKKLKEEKKTEKAEEGKKSDETKKENETELPESRKLLSKEENARRKKELKEKRRENRKLKKDVKVAFRVFE